MKISKALQIFLLTALLIMGVVLGNSSTAEAASITFVNQSGWTIKGLYITNNNDSWGPNRLGGTLENGYSRNVSYDWHNGRYAVAVVFMNGNWWRWGGDTAQNLNSAGRMVIYYEKNDDGSDGFRLYSE